MVSPRQRHGNQQCAAQFVNILFPNFPKDILFVAEHLFERLRQSRTPLRRQVRRRDSVPGQPGESKVVEIFPQGPEPVRAPLHPFHHLPELSQVEHVARLPRRGRVQKIVDPEERQKAFSPLQDRRRELPQADEPQKGVGLYDVSHTSHDLRRISAFQKLAGAKRAAFLMAVRFFIAEGKADVVVDDFQEKRLLLLPAHAVVQRLQAAQVPPVFLHLGRGHALLLQQALDEILLVPRSQGPQEQQDPLHVRGAVRVFRPDRLVFGDILQPLRDPQFLLLDVQIGPQLLLDLSRILRPDRTRFKALDQLADLLFQKGVPGLLGGGARLPKPGEIFSEA